MTELNVELVLSGGNDKSELVFISKDRLAALEELQAAHLAMADAGARMSRALKAAMRRVENLE